MKLGILSALWIGLPALTGAQGFKIDPATIGAGGGISSGGGFTIEGTAGQPAAASSTGDRFEVEGGYWAVVQVPSAPPLTIVRLPGGAVRISWPRPSTGWLLDQSPSLGQAPAPWAEVAAGLIQESPTEHFYLVSNPTGKRFFRLRLP